MGRRREHITIRVDVLENRIAMLETVGNDPAGAKQLRYLLGEYGSNTRIEEIKRKYREG